MSVAASFASWLVERFKHSTAQRFGLFAAGSHASRGKCSDYRGAATAGEIRVYDGVLYSEGDRCLF